MYEPPDFVVREAAGLERFAEVMRADGWDRERILALPMCGSATGREQRAMRQVLGATTFRPGERLLDLGSNTCWASNIAATAWMWSRSTSPRPSCRDCERPITSSTAVRSTSERVLSVMFDPAFVDASFDYVFCCRRCTTTTRRTLHATMRELHRILRPGGRLLMVSEPLRFPLRDEARPRAGGVGGSSTATSTSTSCTSSGGRRAARLSRDPAGRRGDALRAAPWRRSGAAAERRLRH